ncbi:hypothetical protein VTI74DRAFT_11193 [Chaetomium olivicolor]
MMFSEPQPHEHHRKRHREEDTEILEGPVGFTEHRNKRLHSLPLRTSPHSKRWIDPQTFPLSTSTFPGPAPSHIITPEEPIPEQHMWADEPELISGNQPGTMDLDMMDMSEPNYGQDQTTTEGQLNMPSATGRIPTPIHCSFAAQVRGNSWIGGSMTPGDVLATTPEEPNASAFNTNGLVDLASQQLYRPPAAQVMADWSMVQENRRLPSPISECGAEDGVDGPPMALGTSPQFGGHLNHLTHEHPLLAGLPPRAASAFEGRTAREGTPLSESHGGGNAMDVESPATPSLKKGHTRSKHTLNTWTALQPGMKRSFSIGYRADCDKCRNKVPGHFNHIIIS